MSDTFSQIVNILFVHQNFPGQFKHLAPALAARKQVDVRALHMRTDLPESWRGIALTQHRVTRDSTAGIHPWLRDLETKTIRGESALRAAESLRDEGYVPDLIVAHPGWGEMLFLRDVWPQARLGIYSEFYYHAQGNDVGFDPEFPTPDPYDRFRLQFSNLNFDMTLSQADGIITPTHWQAALLPPQYHGRVSVVHDGIDTRQLAPKPSATITLNGRLVLDRRSEIITFVNRNLEPYRGYHIFMRALPHILRERPAARVLIVGGDGLSYGSKPPSGTWKQRFIDEVRPQIPDADWSRVHFLGSLPYAQYLAVMQLSKVHIYLTYPFVLSWSLLEAMSIGCAIVASDTAPVREAIHHDETGLLVDFFDSEGLAGQVITLLGDRDRRRRLGRAARAFARAHYDLADVCLPAQLAWVDAVAGC